MFLHQVKIQKPVPKVVPRLKIIPGNGDGSSPDLCQRARNAAIEFQQELVVLRARRAAKGLVEPYVGVGLHYGDCSYGNIGAPSRLDFTVIGPAVNLAFRVEGLCVELDAQVLATQELVEQDSLDT
jgi:adenylate cyclase